VALLAPDPRRIADPPEAPPADDRVPDAFARGTPEPLRRDMCGLLGSERVLHRASDLVARGRSGTVSYTASASRSGARRRPG